MTTPAKHSILIVDDDLPLLEGLSEFFEIENWQVYRANSITEALTVLEQHPIQVVLTDVRMPEADGLELASNIRDMKLKQKNLVLFFMTGYSDYPDHVLMSLGAEGILRKPFDANECLKEIQSALS